jgi:hypothetical protein
MPLKHTKANRVAQTSNQVRTEKVPPLAHLSRLCDLGRHLRVNENGAINKKPYLWLENKPEMI